MRRPTSHRKFRSGYTLVEVLTVCAIIAILAAMAFPSMVQAIKNARRTKCANNLRQIGIAFAAFSHDHGDRYPHQVPISEGGSREQNLESPVLNGQFILSPLAFLAASSAFQSPQVMVCPATKIWVASFATLNLTNLCYALNLHAEPGSATTALAVDSHLLGDWRQLGQTTLDTRQREILFANSRHDNKGNVLFGDGHVELRKAVAVPPAQLAAAAQAVSSAKNPVPRGSSPATPPRLPTESERQSAYQAANPAPVTGDFGGQSVASTSPVRGGNNAGITPIDTPSRSLPPRARPSVAAGTNLLTPPSPAALELSSTERTLRHSLLWLWLILFLLGAALLAWHFHRQKQRQQERQLRWQALAAEQEQARARRSRPQLGRV